MALTMCSWLPYGVWPSPVALNNPRKHRKGAGTFKLCLNFYIQRTMVKHRRKQHRRRKIVWSFYNKDTVQRPNMILTMRHFGTDLTSVESTL